MNTEQIEKPAVIPDPARAIKLYALFLDDMRHPKSEHSERMWAVSEDPEKLRSLYIEHRCESYEESRDDGYGSTWMKAFRKDSPLEWCNPNYTFEADENEWLEGPELREQRAENARSYFQLMIPKMLVRQISTLTDAREYIERAWRAEIGNCAVV